MTDLHYPAPGAHANRHAYHRHPRINDVYVLTCNGHTIGEVSFLMPPPFTATVLHKLCDTLDESCRRAAEFDEITAPTWKPADGLFERGDIDHWGHK